MSEALIVLNNAKLWCDITEEARLRRAAVLMEAAEVEKCDTPEEQEIAVHAQQSLAQLRRDTEAARKEVKQPVLDCENKIDRTAKDFIAKVAAEELRVSALIADYVALEKARIKSAEAAHNESLLALERERESALATATSLEDREAIHEEFSTKMRDLGPAPAIPRAEGQVVRSDWDFEVVNPLLLAQLHPGLVTITPRKLEIKEALRSGMTIAGIIAKQVIKSTVRSPRQEKALT